MPRRAKKKNSEEEKGSDEAQEEHDAPSEKQNDEEDKAVSGKHSKESVEKAPRADSKKQLSEQIPVPYCCKSVARNCRKDTAEVLRAIVEKLAEGRDAADQEKVKRVERRMKAFLQEIFAKIDEQSSYEKNYAQKVQIKIAEIDQNLVTQLKEAQQDLKDMVKQVIQKKEGLESSLFSELEKEVSESFLAPSQVPITELKIRNKSHTLPFDAFLDKYVNSQNEYLKAISKATELLDKNFDELKIKTMSRFKELIAGHNRVQQIAESKFVNLTSWEQILLK